MPKTMFPTPTMLRNLGASEYRKTVLQNLDAKKAIVNQVINGRLPLVEAASQFEALSGSIDGQEAACRTVIGWVALALSERPEQADTVSDRLELELQNFLKISEQVHLTPKK